MGEQDYQVVLLLQHKFEQEHKAKKNSQSSDFEVAILLQEQFKQELDVEQPKNNLVYSKDKKTVKDNAKSLVDPSWEVIDPTPDIHVLFMAFNERFFWNKLLAVCVSWSKRMTTCAGICSYQGRGGLCSITLSEPLLKLRPRKDLVETLLHEMIHAYLFVTQNNKDRDGHGPEFHKHMYRINSESGTNITVYHDFHDEVRLYKQHWWRCDGPCQHRRPYFGMVKRATNRAPGPNDMWWGEHSRSCGGNFIKVKEPEKPAKKTKSKDNKENTSKPPGDIRKFIPPLQTNSSGLPSTNSATSTNKISNIHTITNNTDNNSKISAVIPSKVNNIFGFSNLNGTSNNLTRPKSTSSANSNGNKFSGGMVKGAVRNGSTMVITKKPSTITGPKTSPPATAYPLPVTKPSSIISTSSGGRTLSESAVKLGDNDYSVVRNHWLNKFTNTNPVTVEKNGYKRPMPKAEFKDNAKVPKLNKGQTTLSNQNNQLMDESLICPVCNKSTPVKELNNHLDVCLVKSSTNETKSCIICEEVIAVTEYEMHVQRCSDDVFSDDVFEEPVSWKICSTCNKKVAKTSYADHLTMCSGNVADLVNLDSQSIETVDLTNLSENTTDNDDTVDLNYSSIEKTFTDEAIGEFTDTTEKSEYKEKNTNCDKRDMIDCPSCMDSIPIVNLSSHIDTCF